MRTKLGVYCDRMIEAGWLAAAAAIPLFFNVYSSRVFEPDKLTLLRSIALIMAAAFIIKTIDSIPLNRSFTSWLREFATATPLSVPVLIFLALYLFTTVTSITPSVSFWGSYQRLQGTLVTLGYLTVFFLTAHHLRTRVQLSRLLWVVVLDATVISLYGLVQHFRLDPLPWGGDVTMRVTSSMGNAIFLAAYLIMAVPLTLALLLSKLSPLTRPVQETANGSLASARPFARVIGPLLAMVFGVTLYFAVSKAVQYTSFRRGLSEFGGSDSALLIVDVLVVLGGIVLLVVRPMGLLAIRRFPLQFSLASVLTTMLLAQSDAILKTLSRGPWIGFGIGLALFAFLFFLRYRLYVLAVLAAAVIAIVMALVVLINVPQSPVASLKGLSPYLERLGSLSDMDSGTSKVRLLIWFGDDVGKGAVGLIKADAWRTLVGYGPESMYVAYNPFYPPSLANLEARNASPDRSHNDVLDYLVTMGVVGLLSYLALVVAFFAFAGRLLWRSEDQFFQLALIAIMAAIAAHLGETFFGIAIAATRTHFWLYLGAAAALYLMSQPQKALANGAQAASSRPVAASVRGSNPSRAILPREGQLRSGKARSRRAPAPPPTSPLSQRSWRGWLSFLPLLVYLIITFVGVPTILLSNVVQLQEPPTIVMSGFLWLCVGLVLTTLWVKRDARPSVSWRLTRLWLYALVVVAAVLVIRFVFLSSIIADIHFKKGQAYDSVRRYDTGIENYLKALREAPNQDFYYLFLGRAYLELARGAPDQKANLEIDSVDDLFGLNDRRVVPSTREDLFNASLVALEKAKSLNPLNTDNSANLGRLFRFWAEVTSDQNKRKERLDTSVKYYADALTLSPNAAHLYDEWGMVYHLQGRFDEAIQKYEKALSLDKIYVSTYVYLGEVYLAQNKLDKAAEMFREATSRDPKLINAHSSLGYIYHQQGKLQEALEENMKAAQLAPNDLVSRRNLAVIYMELGMYDKSIAEAQAALALAPQDQKASFQAFIADVQRRRSGG